MRNVKEGIGISTGFSLFLPWSMYKLPHYSDHSLCSKALTIPVSVYTCIERICLEKYNISNVLSNDLDAINARIKYVQDREPKSLLNILNVMQ